MQERFSMDATALKRFAAEALQRAGAKEQHAADAAEVLTWSSLRGVDTHGIRLLKPYYIDGLNRGDIKADCEFKIEHETPISARVDGDGGLGMAAACWAMRLAIEKAEQTGVGMVAMHNSQHFGAAGYYAHLATTHDMVGQCMTGFLFADGNELGMPPLFSLQPMLSTNPISYAFPSESQPALVVDMATTVVPVNRVERLQAAGKQIPEGWCLDAAGEPTTDPEQAKIYLPLGGGRETGGHKGYGLALAVQSFSGVLSGAWRKKSKQEAAVSTSKGPSFRGSSSNEYGQDGVAHYFSAMRVDAFCPPDQFKQNMDGMLQTLQDAPPAPGQDRVYTPGQIEYETMQERVALGIPIPEDVAEDLQTLSRNYDLELALVTIDNS